MALVLMEVAARALVPRWQPRRAARARFWRPDPQLGWVHQPGESGRFTGPGFDVGVEINARGLRDVPHSYEPTPGRERVLLLSDSFGWGFGVEREEGLAARLQAACPQLEIVNGSASGYSTDQEILWYKREGVKYDSDAVLLLIHANDVQGNSYAKFYGYPKPHFELTPGGLELRNVPVPERTLSDRAYGWLVARTHLGNGVRQAWAGFAVRFEGPPFVGPDGPPVRPEVTRRLLLGFAQELRRAGVELRVALIPMHVQLRSWLKKLVKEQARVPVLDLSTPFTQAEQEERALYLEADTHWNPEGHRLAAEEILRAFLPGCRIPRALNPPPTDRQPARSSG